MSHLQTSAPLQNSLVTELEQLQGQITDIQVMSSYKTSVIRFSLQKIIILFITYSFSENLKRDGVINQRYQSCLLFGSIFGLLLFNQAPKKPKITGYSEKRALTNLSCYLKSLVQNGFIKNVPSQADLEKVINATLSPYKSDVYKLQNCIKEELLKNIKKYRLKIKLNNSQINEIANLILTPDPKDLIKIYIGSLNIYLYNIQEQLKKYNSKISRQKALEKFVILFNHLKKHPEELPKKHPLIEIKNKSLFQLSLDSTFNPLLAQVNSEEPTETRDQANPPAELTYNYLEKTRKTGKKEKPKGVGEANLSKLKQKLEQEKEKAKQAAASAAHTASQVANQAAVDALEAQKAAEFALNKLLSKSSPAKTAAKDAAICALNAAAFAKHVAKDSKSQVQLAIKKKEESERKKLKAKAKTAAFRASSAASMGAASAQSAVDKVLNLLKEQKQKRDLEKKQKRQEFLEKRKIDEQKLQADHAEQESKASDSEQTAAMTAGQIVETQESKSNEVQHPAAMAAESAEESQESKSQEPQNPTQVAAGQILEAQESKSQEQQNPTAMASEPAAAEDSLQPPCGAFEGQPQFQPMQTIDPFLQTQQGALPGMMPGIMPFMPHLVMTPKFETMQLMQQQMFLQQKDAFIGELMTRLNASEQELFSQRVVNGDLAQSLVNQGDSHSRTYMSLHEKLNELIEEKFQREAEAAGGVEPS